MTERPPHANITTKFSGDKENASKFAVDHGFEKTFDLKNVPADNGFEKTLDLKNFPVLPSEKITVVDISTETKKSDAFDYGWCTTDHKSGKQIRREFRTADYINDEPYASRVHAMLEQLGLPQPATEQVFRGTHHDLLFLNNHGVVVRIGPTDVEDLMNPGILQPLGWLEDKDTPIKGSLPLTVAIYPGIELMEQYDSLPPDKKPPLVGRLSELLRVTNQGSGDSATQGNTGVIRIIDSSGKEVAVQMLVDADNEFNGSSHAIATRRSTTLKAHAATSPTEAPNKGELMFNTLRDVFNAAKNVHYWERALEAHQPLRVLFGEAFQGVEPVTGKPDEAKRKAFWDKCASVTNNPQPTTMATWKSEKAPDGGLTFTREEIPVPNLVLYRPWTGLSADQVVAPIQQTPELKAAVQRAHTEQMNKVSLAETVVDAAKLAGVKGVVAFGKRVIKGLVG